MIQCLICDKRPMTSPSWKGLLGLDERTIICQDCSIKFERAEIIEEGTIIDQVTSLYSYNEAMRDYLHQYKFLQDVALAEVFAEELKSYLRKEAIIVPIPMHPHKQMERTFSHIDELLNSTGLAYQHLLEKRSVDSMGEKSKKERLAMQPLFKLKQHTEITDGTYVIVDDIYTTGTTLRHAANILKQAGAERIEAVTLIRASDESNRR